MSNCWVLPKEGRGQRKGPKRKKRASTRQEKEGHHYHQKEGLPDLFSGVIKKRNFKEKNTSTGEGKEKVTPTEKKKDRPPSSRNLYRKPARRKEEGELTSERVSAIP